MKTVLLTLTLILLSVVSSYSTTLTVGQNGLGKYATISAAINDAKPGDVIKVYPGTYEEKVVINKDILVEGSGAENTMISNQNKDFAVVINIGKLKWFSITSADIGLNAGGGLISNCIFENCTNHGCICYNGSKILNCISYNNENGFFIASKQIPIITNCIAFQNRNSGFKPDQSYGGYKVEYCLAYSNKYNYYSDGWYTWVSKSTGSIEDDPKFNIDNWNISPNSPCYHTGNPAYQDPDGYQASMGYYGGPDEPTFPVIRQSLIKLNDDGTIQIEAIGISSY